MIRYKSKSLRLASLNDFDLYLITGSKASVYDDEEWILNLFEFVRSLDDAKKNILGFCFGHQVIAQALGGHVQKHPHEDAFEHDHLMLGQ